MTVIELKDICKSYAYYEKEEGVKGSIKNIFIRKKLYKNAVQKLNFKIERGSIVGFIGLNGAGKTTTLKMLSGILRPSSGEINVLGYNPFDKKPDYLKQIAMVMGNKSQLWWDLPAIDSFELNRQIFDVNLDTYNRVLYDMVDRLNVRHLLKIQVRRLSLGERMKMELISALIHSPTILFLDEPTIGLDIISQHNIREFLKEYNKKYNNTIILTSHNFDDIVHLCDYLIIIDKGKIIYKNSYKSFLQSYSTKKILTIKFLNGIDAFSKILENDNYEILENGVDGLKISVPENNAVNMTNYLTSKYHNVIKDISIESIDIKEIIRDIYK